MCAMLTAPFAGIHVSNVFFDQLVAGDWNASGAGDELRHAAINDRDR